MSTKSLKAAYLNGPNKIEVFSIPRPKCPDGGVLIKVAYTGICGSDLLMFKGEREQPNLPIGHEFSGTIEELDCKIKDFKIGDRVCVEAVYSCGLCDWCIKGNTHLCYDRLFMPQTGLSGLSEVASVPVNCIHMLPQTLDFKNAILAEPLSVGLHALRRVDKSYYGRLLILGAGSLGLSTAMVAKSIGIKHIEIVARYPHQISLAKHLNVDEVYTEKDKLEPVYDIVINTVPGQIAMDIAIDNCRRRGIIVLCGGYFARESYAFRAVVSNEITLTGSICYTRKDFYDILKFLGENKLPQINIITHEFQLNDVQKAFETALDKEQGAVKVIVNMNNWRSI
ncbi:MAG: alcohol dehydrogenase catalytic domain-containing protein [Desulfobacterales bacterium]|nr:alcohol dehydrogenase catalytic domain-containing protein [Desulfobacterales bacterium]